MTSEHNVRPQADTEVNGLTFDTTLPIVDDLLNDPACIERTCQLIRDLEHTDPTLFKSIEDGTQGIAAMLSAGLPAPSIATQAVLDDPTATISKDGTGITVHDGRRLMHMCLLCGNLYDRKPRADDCQNRDRGVKPHVCHGECGKKNCDRSYALEELLTRHWATKESRFTNCGNCLAKVSKHNLARHIQTCGKHQRPSKS